jgi:hypothetical protein
MKKRSLSAKIQAHKITELATVRYSRINRTIPVILKRIRQKRKPCEDCPRSVKDRRLEAHCILKPIRHWIQKCVNCDQYLDRDTGEYNLTWMQAHNKAVTASGYFRSTQYKSMVEMREARRRELAREASRRYSERQKSLRNPQDHKDSDK